MIVSLRPSGVWSLLYREDPPLFSLGAQLVLASRSLIDPHACWSFTADAWRLGAREEVYISWSIHWRGMRTILVGRGTVSEYGQGWLASSSKILCSYLTDPLERTRCGAGGPRWPARPGCTDTCCQCVGLVGENAFCLALPSVVFSLNEAEWACEEDQSC